LADVTQAAANGRWVELEGAANVRDLGGLPLASGGRTAAGVVLRADNLQGLTARDVARLVDELGVRLVVDLRTRVEIDLEGPGPLARDGRVDVRSRSLYPEAGARTDIDAGVIFPWRARNGDADDSEPPVVRAYLGYLRDRPDSIVAALRDTAGAQGATIVHCAAGKDRTGVVAAFALAVAGVRRDAIVADYVATEERLARLVARLRASPTYGADLRGRTLDSHRPRAETMKRVLELVDERHGGPVEWLAQHGFDAAEAAELRARLEA
jgi:protein-tyrosine phosphatase